MDEDLGGEDDDDDEEEEEVMTITRIGKDDGGSIVLDPLGVVLRVLGLLLQHHDVWVHLCSLSFTHSLLSVLGIQNMIIFLFLKITIAI